MTRTPKQPLTVIDGEMSGHPVRKARKTFSCDGWTNKIGHAKIFAGDYYVEGFATIDVANGFGHDRYCIACVAPITVSRPELQALIDATAKVPA